LVLFSALLRPRSQQLSVFLSPHSVVALGPNYSLKRTADRALR
jgi:hypothetical protein